MKIYTVHIKPDQGNAREKPVFVREGFNIWAFFFSFLWLFFHRLWIPGIVVILVNVLLVALLNHHALSSATVAVLHFTVHLMVGFHAHDWWRAGLRRRGYIVADIASGDSLLRAEQRYFERYLASA